MVTGKGNQFVITALNTRGNVLLPAFMKTLTALKNDDEKALSSLEFNLEAGVISGNIIRDSNVLFTEEDRSRRPSHFTIIRHIVQLFSCNDPQLGLYGAFGYDLGLQFEAIKCHLKRDPDQNDLVLYLPDSVTVVDQDKGDAWMVCYDFSFDGKTTKGLMRSGREVPFELYSAVNHEASVLKLHRALPKGQYSEQVQRCRVIFSFFPILPFDFTYSLKSM